MKYTLSKYFFNSNTLSFFLNINEHGKYNFNKTIFLLFSYKEINKYGFSKIIDFITSSIINDKNLGIDKSLILYDSNFGIIIENKDIFNNGFLIDLERKKNIFFKEKKTTEEIYQLSNKNQKFFYLKKEAIISFSDIIKNKNNEEKNFLFNFNNFYPENNKFIKIEDIKTGININKKISINLKQYFSNIGSERKNIYIRLYYILLRKSDKKLYNNVKKLFTLLLLFNFPKIKDVEDLKVYREIEKKITFMMDKKKSLTKKDAFYKIILDNIIYYSYIQLYKRIEKDYTDEEKVILKKLFGKIFSEKNINKDYFNINNYITIINKVCNKNKIGEEEYYKFLEFILFNII